MTAPLPTREEIIDIVIREIPIGYGLGTFEAKKRAEFIADALLARLRPALEHESGLHEYRGSAISCDEYEAIRGKAIAERDALHATLARKDEALRAMTEDRDRYKQLWEARGAARTRDLKAQGLSGPDLE